MAARLSCAAVWDQRYCQTSRIDYRTRVASFTVERRISRNSALVRRSLLSLEDSRIEFANLQIGFQLAYYRVRLFRLKAGGKGINVDTPRKTGGLLQRPVSHCLRCCSLPCIRSPPFSPRPPSPCLRHRPPVPRLSAEVKLDKWMLTLNINRLLRLIINLTSDSKQTFHLCSSLLSRLHLPSLRLLRKLCNAFYLFTKANTHLPQRHGERPLHFASGKVTVREYTCSHFILCGRG